MPTTTSQTGPGPTYAVGSTIVCREVFAGHVWLELPVTVVADEGGVLALLVEPGAPFSFPTHPFGPHPWSGAEAWGGAQVLRLYRDGDPYSVWLFFTDGELTGWYVNFEEPMVRRPDGVDTDDHELDLWVEPDGTRRWKDVECLAARVRQGRLTWGQVTAALVAGEEVWALLDADDRWWSPWDGWRPPNPDTAP